MILCCLHTQASFHTRACLSHHALSSIKKDLKKKNSHDDMNSIPGRTSISGPASISGRHEGKEVLQVHLDMEAGPDIIHADKLTSTYSPFTQDRGSQPSPSNNQQSKPPWKMHYEVNNKLARVNEGAPGFWSSLGYGSSPGYEGPPRSNLGGKVRPGMIWGIGKISMVYR